MSGKDVASRRTPSEMSSVARQCVLAAKDKLSEDDVNFIRDAYPDVRDRVKEKNSRFQYGEEGHLELMGKIGVWLYAIEQKRAGTPIEPALLKAMLGTRTV